CEELRYHMNSNNKHYPDNSLTYARLMQISERTEYQKKHHFKIGIIVPPSPFVVPNGWEFVHSAPFEGPSIISAVLRGLGFEVVVLDQREDFNADSLAGGLLNSLDLIGIATYEDSFPYIKRAAEIAKQEEPDRIVILGGPLVTSVPELVMNNVSADYAVLGEGELTVIELMDNLINAEESLPVKQIEGLAWKDRDGRVVINDHRRQMHNLDVVPVQDLSVWSSIQKTGKTREIYMTSSRGCPGNCSFCFRPMPALRYKSPARVKRELKYLKKYGYQFVWWSDLTFIDSKDRIQKLMDEALSGLDCRWSCFTRVDGLDLKVLEHMRDKGCDIVMYGFESITKEILEYFRKKVTKNQIIKAITLTREAGLKAGGLFIIGGPGETVESLQRVENFCKEFKEVTRVKYMSAIPGTKLYYDSIKSGLIQDELKHLYFLSRERSAEDDEIINFTDLPEELLRKTYREINSRIEIRPYEYWNPANRYLDQPEKFKNRPVIMSS
ncbi:B12-binding domain-containing radical SAM protein, partial [Elusimicrobiota bacterium]